MFIDKVLLFNTVQRGGVINSTELGLRLNDALLGSLSDELVFHFLKDCFFGSEVVLFSIMHGLSISVHFHGSIAPCVEHLTVILRNIHLRIHVSVRRSVTLEVNLLWLALAGFRA